MSKATGGTAYPAGQWHDPQSGKTHDRPGMTLRDYFAAKAMQSIITESSHVEMEPSEAIASVSKVAYEIADAMLTERAK